MSLASTVFADGFVFLEGPRWHAGKLWLSDMHDDRVLTLDAQGTVETVVEVPGRPSGLGWTPDDRLLVVSMVDRRLLRLDPGGLAPVADLGDIATYHCNDMVVDARGRAYVGNFGSNLEDGGLPDPAALALVLPDGTVRIAAADLRFPNGTVLTPDGRTLVVGESFGACLTAFDVADDGSLSRRREWARLDGAIPDGICLDAESAIWVASPISNEVVRVREGGAVTHRIPVGQMAIACMLGGDDRRTLFVLTAPTTNREACRTARAARVETVRVDVPGAGLP
ncbi:MAG: SMP-30/gluconolactonase/LRE family protein [bacterium]|nr:SMP-30/gluconolactonase/LRE family protein [bacterium]